MSNALIDQLHGQSELVEFYRVDPFRRIVKPLVLGISCLVVGSLLVAVGLVLAKTFSSARIAAAIIGGISTIAGPAIAISGLHRALREESYLAAQKTGIVLRMGDQVRFVKWDDIEEFVATQTGVRIVTKTGDISLDERFSNVSSDELAKRLAALRRKALFQLL